MDGTSMNGGGNIPTVRWTGSGSESSASWMAPSRSQVREPAVHVARGMGSEDFGGSSGESVWLGVPGGDIKIERGEEKGPMILSWV